MHSLAHLSDEELVAQLIAFCRDMRRSKIHTLVFLAEVEQREVHLAAAASSMWDYARRFLSMSHGSAYRYIACSRLCRRFPFLLERIEKGEVFISTLTHIASFITPDNVHELVEETVGKNRAQVDLFLARRFGVEPRHGQVGSPVPYDEELLAMMNRARELLSHVVPDGDRLAIAKIAFGLLIAHLENTKRAKTDRPRPPPTKVTTSIPRHATREMFAAHGDQCSFVDERTGERCSSRAYIERDHRQMRAHGGTHDPKNLRPMCRAHNNWLAKQALGRAYVEQRIRFRQRNEKKHT